MKAPLMLLVIAAALVVDQVTKAFALSLLLAGMPLSVLPGFKLTLGFNEGASFGMWSGVMAGKPLVMVGITGLLTLGLAVIAFRSRDPLERAGCALIVGGALGNIFDRVRQGAVTDFLDFYWRDWHWPTFNFADISIFLGALCILVAALSSPRRKNSNIDQN